MICNSLTRMSNDHRAAYRCSNTTLIFATPFWRSVDSLPHPHLIACVSTRTECVTSDVWLCLTTDCLYNKTRCRIPEDGLINASLRTHEADLSVSQFASQPYLFSARKKQPTVTRLSESRPTKYNPYHSTFSIKNTYCMYTALRNQFFTTFSLSNIALLLLT